MDLAAITEFPDRIHPMLVRELRARLREPRLLLGMIVGHIILALAALSAVVGQEPGIFAGFLWPISAVLLMIITYSAGGSLRGEVRRGNFQLLQLVGIDAQRLVRGKWIATAALLLLVAVSLLPWYAFLGNFPGYNPLIQILFLLTFLAINALLAASELWAASHEHPAAFWVVRAVVTLTILVFGAQVTFGVMFAASFGRVSGGELLATMLTLLASVLCVTAWLTWLCLGVCSCLLSTEQEDFLRPQRTAAWLLPPLLVLIGWAVFRWVPAFADWREIVLTVGLSLCALVVATATVALLAERPPRGARAHRLHSARFAWLGPLRRLVLPGRQRLILASVFGLLCLLVYPPAFGGPWVDPLVWENSELNGRLLVAGYGLGLLWFALGVAHLIRRDEPGRHRGFTFLLCLVGTGFLQLFVVMFFLQMETNSGLLTMAGLSLGLGWAALALADAETRERQRRGLARSSGQAPSPPTLGTPPSPPSPPPTPAA